MVRRFLLSQRMRKCCCHKVSHLFGRNGMRTIQQHPRSMVSDLPHTFAIQKIIAPDRRHVPVIQGFSAKEYGQVELEDIVIHCCLSSEQSEKSSLFSKPQLEQRCRDAWEHASCYAPWNTIFVVLRVTMLQQYITLTVVSS